jgi:hypothetical protein
VTHTTWPFPPLSGYIFPALIAGLVPLRSYVVCRLFTKGDLAYLDPFEETEDDYVEEQKEIIAAERRPSIDEAELFHGFSEFRTKDIPHDAKEYYQHHPEIIPRQPSSSEDDHNGLRQRHSVESETYEC